MFIKMMTDRSGFQKAIDDVKNEWLGNLLLFLGVDVQTLKDDAPAFVEYLLLNKIEIIEYNDLNALEVKYENDVVGEWGSPTFTLKKDEKGELYFEIEIESWSIIEDNITT
jgi:hypothetical protein